MNKLVVLAPFCEADLAMIREAAEGQEVIFAPKATEAEQAELLADADIVIGQPGWEILESNHSLALVQMTWAGADRYTRAGRKFPEGVRLCCASGAFGPIMSQYALGGLLSLCRHLPDYRLQQEQAVWQPRDAGRSLVGADVLIFGAGNIGSCTAKLLRAAGAAHITGVRRGSAVPEGFDAVCTLEAAEGLLPGADVVVCCMPDTGSNRGWLHAGRLAAMKQGSMLLNMGRGNFIDCLALAEALQSGHLYGAVLDVTSPEPLPKDHPLWQAPNVIITPHIAGPSFGDPATEHLVAAICSENIRHFRRGEPLRSQIFFD